ncbi:MAG: host cell division inhibitor Icd-like protein [Enterobacteriaceae bacterium]|jgi:hypothetical protein|nr:host cell division inhibitor Icd-like protein [Enterobacteriaceae bacterium]
MTLNKNAELTAGDRFTQNQHASLFAGLVSLSPNNINACEIPRHQPRKGSILWRVSHIVKKHLPLRKATGYSHCVAAKSAIRRGNLNNTKAATDALRVFFYAVATAHQYNPILSMVALVGRRSRLPVSFVSGISTPANVTAHSERGNSGGDSLNNTKEAITMAAPTQTQFKFLFLALNRSDLHATPHRESVTAPDEQSARRLLAPQFILVFAGRLPVQAVIYA